MKTNFLIFFVGLNLLITEVYATDVKTVKIHHKSTKIKLIKSLTNPKILCSQKDLPFKVESNLDGQSLTVVFETDQPIENFSLNNVRGIDGQIVSKFQEILNQSLVKGDAIESVVELEDIKGLGYVVFDVNSTVRNSNRTYSIPIAIGELSLSQMKERSQNIKKVNYKSLQKNGLSSPTKIIHEMKLK